MLHTQFRVDQLVATTSLLPKGTVLNEVTVQPQVLGGLMLLRHKHIILKNTVMILTVFTTILPTNSVKNGQRKSVKEGQHIG